MNTRHPLSGVSTYIQGNNRVIDCPVAECRWESRTRRGNALAMAAILLGELTRHVRATHPEQWTAWGGKPERKPSPPVSSDKNATSKA